MRVKNAASKPCMFKIHWWMLSVAMRNCCRIHNCLMNWATIPALTFRGWDLLRTSCQERTIRSFSQPNLSNVHSKCSIQRLSSHSSTNHSKSSSHPCLRIKTKLWYKQNLKNSAVLLSLDNQTLLKEYQDLLKIYFRR